MTPTYLKGVTERLDSPAKTENLITFVISLTSEQEEAFTRAKFFSFLISSNTKPQLGVALEFLTDH